MTTTKEKKSRPLRIEEHSFLPPNETLHTGLQTNSIFFFFDLLGIFFGFGIFLNQYETEKEKEKAP